MTLKPGKTAENHIPTHSKTMGVSVAKLADNTTMTDKSNTEEEVTISKNTLVILVNEAEQTVESIDDPEWHQNEKITDAINEAYEQLD